MGGQCFSITVPFSNSTLAAGAGAVDGITLTTDENVFQHAGTNSITEACGDARMVAGGVLGAAGGQGVLIGTPCTIQASAGGGVQIYAGAGISPSFGGPSGPGAPFGPSEPASFDAGTKAESLNRINDGLRSANDVVGAARDLRGAVNAFDKVKAGYEMAKGGWNTAKAMGASNETVDDLFKAGDLLMAYGSRTRSGMSGDIVDFVIGSVDFYAKGASAIASASPVQGGAGLGNATAPTAATSTDGAAGGSMGAPGDGPRIHQVAPGNIDRKCGADMTAVVAGTKTTKVDGNIAYQSGTKIEFKAFSKVETQSLFFEAHANVGATVRGLAQVKVEALGRAVLEGKATFKIATMGKGKVEAKSALDIQTAKLTVKAGQTKIGPGKVQIGPGPVTIDSVTTINKKTEIKGALRVAKKTEIKGALHVNNKINAKGEIKGNATLRNRYFRAG